MKYIVVFITASSEDEASKIADGLIDSRACACVNIIPKIKSVFIWEGKKDTADEYLLIAKTKKDKFDELKRKVKELHSYDVPEIICMPIDEGEKKYLDWIDSVLQ